MTVYGDVLFLIDFSMDFLLLFSVSRIMHLRAAAKRLVLSAALGGAYAVAALFIGNVFLSVICNIAAALIMCLISFPKAGRAVLLKCTVLFYGLSLLLGGCITAFYILLSKLGKEKLSQRGAAPFMTDVPLGTFLLLGAVSAALSYITGRIFGRQNEKKEADVTVSGKGGLVRLKCLSDSGALIREPLSGSPVLIVDLNSIKKCVDPELFEALSCRQLCKTADKMRLIPCSGVNGDSILPGFLPEKVTVNGTERKAVVAVTENTDYGGFDGIVPASLCS